MQRPSNWLEVKYWLRWKQVGLHSWSERLWYTTVREIRRAYLHGDLIGLIDRAINRYIFRR